MDTKDVDGVKAVLRRQLNGEAVQALVAGYDRPGTGRNLTRELYGRLFDETDVTPETAAELENTYFTNGMVAGRDAAQIAELLARPVTGPSGGSAAAEVAWMAVGASGEYDVTMEHRGVLRRIGERTGDPETKQLMVATRDRVSELKTQWERTTDPQERQHLFSEIRKARAALTGDADAYEKETEQIVAEFRSAVSFAVSIALAVALPGVGAGLGFLEATALNIGANIAANIVIKGDTYSVSDLEGDLLGGIAGAAGGKLGEELLGKVAQKIAGPVAKETGIVAERVGIRTELTEAAEKMTSQGEKIVIDTAEVEAKLAGTAAKAADSTFVSVAKETGNILGGTAATKVISGDVSLSGADVVQTVAGIFGGKLAGRRVPAKPAQSMVHSGESSRRNVAEHHVVEPAPLTLPPVASAPAPTELAPPSGTLTPPPDVVQNPPPPAGPAGPGEAGGPRNPPLARSDNFYELPGQIPATGEGLQEPPGPEGRRNPNAIMFHDNLPFEGIRDVTIANASDIPSGGPAEPGTSLIPEGTGATVPLPTAAHGGLEVRTHGKNPQAAKFGPDTYSANNDTTQINTPGNQAYLDPVASAFGQANADAHMPTGSRYVAADQVQGAPGDYALYGERPTPGGPVHEIYGRPGLDALPEGMAHDVEAILDPARYQGPEPGSGSGPGSGGGAAPPGAPPAPESSPDIELGHAGPGQGGNPPSPPGPPGTPDIPGAPESAHEFELGPAGSTVRPFKPDVEVWGSSFVSDLITRKNEGEAQVGNIARHQHQGTRGPTRESEHVTPANELSHRSVDPLIGAPDVQGRVGGNDTPDVANEYTIVEHEAVSDRKTSMDDAARRAMHASGGPTDFVEDLLLDPLARHRQASLDAITAGEISPLEATDPIHRALVAQAQVWERGQASGGMALARSRAAATGQPIQNLRNPARMRAAEIARRQARLAIEPGGIAGPEDYDWDATFGGAER